MNKFLEGFVSSWREIVAPFNSWKILGEIFGGMSIAGAVILFVSGLFFLIRWVL